MIFGLIARGIVLGIEAIQLTMQGVSSAKKFVNAVRRGTVKLPDETDPFPLTYKDAERINQAARNAGHESPGGKAK